MVNSATTVAPTGSESVPGHEVQPGVTGAVKEHEALDTSSAKYVERNSASRDVPVRKSTSEEALSDVVKMAASAVHKIARIDMVIKSSIRVKPLSLFFTVGAPPHPPVE